MRKTRKTPDSIAALSEGYELSSLEHTTQNFKGVRVDASPIALSVLVSGLALLYGTAFQIGYFSSIGSEFLPLLGAFDIAFPAAALISWMFVWYPVAAWIRKWLHRRLHTDGLQTSYVWRGLVTYIRFELVLFWLALVALFVTGVDIVSMFPWAATIVCFVCSNILIAALQEDNKFLGYFTTSNVVWFAVHSAFLAIGIGSIYASYFAGRHCWFKTAETFYWDATYMRPIGDGHLLRQSGRTVFLNKSEVKEIACGRFRPEKIKGDPLKSNN